MLADSTPAHCSTTEDIKQLNNIKPEQDPRRTITAVNMAINHWYLLLKCSFPKVTHLLRFPSLYDAFLTSLREQKTQSLICINRWHIYHNLPMHKPWNNRKSLATVRFIWLQRASRTSVVRVSFTSSGKKHIFWHLTQWTSLYNHLGSMTPGTPLTVLNRFFTSSLFMPQIIIKMYHIAPGTSKEQRGPGEAVRSANVVCSNDIC